MGGYDEYTKQPVALSALTFSGAPVTSGQSAWTAATIVMMAAVDALLRQVRLFLGRDVPELLVIGGRALEKAPWPSSVADILSLKRSEVVELLPLAGFLCSVVMIMLLQWRPGKNSETSNSYWLARVLLLRGVALLYLSGFLSFAFQARALFGSLGIQQRPTGARNDWRGVLAVYLLAHTCSVDWALEIVSWAGVFLSLVLLTSQITSALLPTLMWYLYLSLIDAAGGASEWLTLEIGFLR